MDCRLQHLGPWFVEDRWFVAAVEAVTSGVLQPSMQQEDVEPDDDDEEVQRGPNGMAIVHISGHMVKGRSSFGGASTVSLRRRVRALTRDDSITGIMLKIESPGGVVDGTFELAEDVREAAALLPVRAHIEDIGASAAYWVASQTQFISANAMAEVGSIGAVAIVVDSSKRAENEGLKVHVFATGPLKGMGAPGVKITDEQVSVFQERIDDAFAFFLSGVEQGRGLSGGDLARVATGRVWIAEKALKLGLLDAVQSWETAVASFAAKLEQPFQQRGVPLLNEEQNRTVRLTELELEIGAGVNGHQK